MPLPLPDASADHVFAMHALAFMRTPERLVAEGFAAAAPAAGRLVMAALQRPSPRGGHAGATTTSTSACSRPKLQRLLERCRAGRGGLPDHLARGAGRPISKVVTALARKPWGL